MSLIEEKEERLILILDGFLTKLNSDGGLNKMQHLLENLQNLQIQVDTGFKNIQTTLQGFKRTIIASQGVLECSGRSRIVAEMIK